MVEQVFITEIVAIIISFIIDIEIPVFEKYTLKFGVLPFCHINRVNRLWNHVFYYWIGQRKEYKSLKLGLFEDSIKQKIWQRTLQLIHSDWKNLKRCYIQTKQICHTALNINPISVRYIKFQSFELFDNIAKMYAFEKKTRPYNFYGLKQMRQTLKYVDFQKFTYLEYKTICSIFVRIEGQCLEHVRQDKLTKKDYYDICVMALHNDGFAIYFIANKTKELCLIAQENNPMSIRYCGNSRRGR